MTATATGSVQALSDRIVDAAEHGTSLRIVGRGMWLDAGRPVTSTATISTRELKGITEYVPGDLTLTAHAGTTLAEIRDATAAHGQWLALDPNGSDEGSIGATIATASCGPLSAFFGTPRDLVLGVEFVTGSGTIARGGGRVVKNVAGFDLSRLMTGAWGTLGVLTEVTVRLHARPEVDHSLSLPVDPSAESVATVRRLLRRLPFSPLACEVVNAPLARLLTGEARAVALFRLGGNEESVRAQRAALAELGDATDVPEEIWQRLRAIAPADASVLRVSQLADVASTWHIARALGEDVLLHASPTRGIVRCIVPETVSRDTLERWFRESSTVTRIGERLPADLWPLCGPSPVGDRISRGIKRTFDPANVLNPGILGELA